MLDEETMLPPLAEAELLLAVLLPPRSPELPPVPPPRTLLFPEELAHAKGKSRVPKNHHERRRDFIEGRVSPEPRAAAELFLRLPGLFGHRLGQRGIHADHQFFLDGPTL